MAPNMRILLIWIGACVFLHMDRVHGEKRCAFPFTYAGKKYFDCTRHDSMNKWCSLDKEYLGRWKYYTKDDYARCFFPFSYNGKLYDSCTMDGSLLGMAWCSVTENFNKDGAWKSCF